MYIEEATEWHRCKNGPEYPLGDRQRARTHLVVVDEVVFLQDVVKLGDGYIDHLCVLTSGADQLPGGEDEDDNLGRARAKRRLKGRLTLF